MAKIIGKVAVRVYPDTSKFPEDLKRQLREMKDQKQQVPVEAELDSKKLDREMRIAMAKLKAKAAKDPVEIKANIDVDEKNIARDIEEGAASGKVRAQRQLDELAAPKLFDELRNVQVFDPSSIDDYQRRIKQINNQIKATTKLQEQRLRATREAEARLAQAEGDRVARNKKIMDDLQKSLKAQLRLEAQRQAAEAAASKAAAARNKQILNDLAKSVAAQKKLEDQRTRALADQAREAERVAAAQTKYANEHKKANAELDRSIRDLDRYFAKINRTAGQLPGHIREARGELDRIRSQRSTIGFNIDIAGIEDYKERVRKLRDWTEDEFDDIKANIDPEVSEAFYRRAQSRLAWLARTRIVQLIPTVNKAAAAKAATALAALSGARMVGESLRNLRDFFKDIDKNLPKIALMATGFLNLASAVLAGSSNLFALSSSLAQIAPIALALPGLFTGMALGLTALIVPLLDINKELPELKEQWELTRKAMSKGFWKEARDPLREFANKLLPAFRIGMTETAREMGTLVGTFGKLFTKRMTAGPMKRMFADLAESISVAESGAAGMVEVITILGEKGAGLLPRLSGYFVDLTNRFANFLHQADDDGRLDMWIERAIVQMKELGNVIFEAGRILGGLGKAAEIAGGSTLKSLADVLKDIADVVNGEAFQQQLVDVFVAAHKAMQLVADISGPAVRDLFMTLAGTLETILPVAGRFAGILLYQVARALSQTAMQRGIIDLLDGLLAALKLLAPAFQPVGEALGVMLSLIGELAKDFAPLLRVALTTIADVFIALAPSIAKVADSLSTGLLAVFEALSPVLVDVAEAIGPVLEKLGGRLGKVLEKNAPVLAEFAEVLGVALVDALDVLADYLPEIVDKLLPQLLQVVKDVAPKIPELVKGFLGLGDALVSTDLIPKLGELVGSLLELIASDVLPELVLYLPTVATSMSDLATALTAVSDGLGALDTLQGILIFLGAINDLVSIFDPARILIDVVNGFREGLASGDWDKFWFDFAMRPVNIVKKILGIHSPSTVFAEIGRNVIEGLLNGVNELAPTVGPKMGEIATKIKQTFDGSGGWLISPGAKLVTGLISGIGSMIGPAGTRAGELATKIKNVFATASTWLKDRGSQFVSGLISGIGSRISAAGTRARDLRDRVKDVFNNASTLLHSAGGNIAQGLASGIRDGVSWVTSAARSIASAARAAAERILDINSPSRVFAGIGEFVSLGLAQGILAERDSVVSAVEKLADAMQEVEFNIEPAVDVDYSDRQIKTATSNFRDPGAGEVDPADPEAPITFNINNYNPVAEPTSVTTTRTLREAQSMGVTR